MTDKETRRAAGEIVELLKKYPDMVEEANRVVCLVATGDCAWRDFNEKYGKTWETYLELVDKTGL